MLDQILGSTLLFIMITGMSWGFVNAVAGLFNSIKSHLGFKGIGCKELHLTDAQKELSRGMGLLTRKMFLEQILTNEVGNYKHFYYTSATERLFYKN